MPRKTKNIQRLVDAYLLVCKNTREGHHKTMLQKFVTFSVANTISPYQVTVKDIESFIQYLQ